MRISAVIPVWNGRDCLARLLRTLEIQTFPCFEIIVVDNGSEDGAGDLAAAQGAKVIRFAQNRGFAVAVNQGVAESIGDAVAILNSDVELHDTWLETLSGTLSNFPNAWFAVGRILSARNPERIDGTWDLISRAGLPWRAGHGAPAAHPEFQQPKSIAIAPFTAILVRRELWRRVGPLDERFESYLEDVDFGIRCAAAGFIGCYEPAAECLHQGSATLGRWNGESVRRMSRNQIFLVRKHFRKIAWWHVIAGQALWGMVAFRNGAMMPWIAGKIEGLSVRVIFREISQPPEDFLSGQERDLLSLQARLGWDNYWRWYARLIGWKSEAK